MSNNNWPHGFRPLMVDTAGAPVGVKEYAKPSSDANAIYTFDFLRKVAGSQTVEGQIIPTPTIQTAAIGTPGTALILGSSLNFGAASSATWHTVVDDPGAIFEAQISGNASWTVANAPGLNANILNTAQTNGTLISAMQVNASTIVNTAGLDLRILDFSRNVGNSEGANPVVEVLILKHAYAYGSAGN
jgi:hypothetical protein